MSKKTGSLLFLALLGILALVIAGHNFERYYIAKNYPLHVFIACDPAAHSCFVADPATADPTFQVAPYAKVEMTAAYAPSCLDEHDCSSFSCDSVAGACHITYCSGDTEEDGETCSGGNL